MSRSVMRKWGVALLAIGGLILWNAWVLGFLNHGVAGYTQMSISELNVTGQPFARFFTTTEWLSGLCLVLGSLGLVLATRKGSFMLIALLLSASIGGLTIFDATHPLDCNRYQNQTCELKWARGDVSTAHKEHGIESQITDYVTVLLAAFLAAGALFQKLSQKDVSYLKLSLIIALAVAMFAPFVVPSSTGIVIESIGQRIWNTLTSLLFLYIIYAVSHSDTPSRQSYSQRKSRKAIA